MTFKVYVNMSCFFTKSIPYEMRMILCIKSHQRALMQHSAVWGQWNAHYHALLLNTKLEVTGILEINFFVSIY